MVKYSIIRIGYTDKSGRDIQCVISIICALFISLSPNWNALRTNLSWTRYRMLWMGFGRAILLKAIEKLKDAKAKEIMLQVAAENATALRLYKSCGFQETSVMDYFELE